MRSLVITIAIVSGSCNKGSKSSEAEPVPAVATAPAVPAAPARHVDGVSQDEAHALALAVCPKVTHAVYFAIEKDGKISHVLGTRHFGVGIDRFPPAIQTELQRAKLAVFETAPDDATSLPDPPSALPDLLGKPAWDHVRELVGDDRATQLATSAPLYVALIVPSIYEDLSDELDDELGKLATAAKIATRGLESSLSQDQLLHDVFTPDTTRAIVMSIKSRDEIKADTTSDLEGYCKGNVGDGGFDAQTRRYLKAAGFDDAKLSALEERMVFARTAAWLPKLEPMLAEGGAFIAVGAAHLVGDRGLVALLIKAGYKVTPVTP